jgi:alanine racemase
VALRRRAARYLTVLRALARVNLAAIERNCARLAQLARPAALCAVVKADGYGHGAASVAHAARTGGATWLAVATAREATELRAAGLDGPLLVVGALSSTELREAVDARADVVAWREAFVQALAGMDAAEGIGVHVKLDSGMGRLGTRDPVEADAVAAAVAHAPRLRLAGAMTHFATADDDHDFLRQQLSAFAPWAQGLRAAHPDVLVHAANSAAAIACPPARLDMVRCGIGIYGLDPFHRDPYAHGLEPALSLHSYVAEVKRCGAGESVGYGRRFIADTPVWVATIPIGYGDGVRRGLSNHGEVLVGGRRRPVAGTVSMDNLGILLGSEAPEPGTRGAAAVLIGSQLGERILAEEVASWLGTINYEVTCGISVRVPRAYHRDGEPVEA